MGLLRPNAIVVRQPRIKLLEREDFEMIRKRIDEFHMSDIERRTMSNKQWLCDREGEGRGTLEQLDLKSFCPESFQNTTYIKSSET